MNLYLTVCQRERPTSFFCNETILVQKIVYIQSNFAFFYNALPHQLVKVSKGAKIRNRYNQVPHLTQDTNGKVTIGMNHVR